MSHLTMSIEQQFLPEGSALALPPEAVERELLVTAGRLWLTGPDVIGDVWLQPGERHRLPAGASVVVEGWPSANLVLRPLNERSTASAWRGWLVGRVLGLLGRSRRAAVASAAAASGHPCSAC